VAILGTMLVLRLLTLATPVSLFALNVTTALGLGLAIDYSLFIVSRYRDELRRGLGTHEAILAAMRTAGRAVAFRAVLVPAIMGLAGDVNCWAPTMSPWPSFRRSSSAGSRRSRTPRRRSASARGQSG
jgi:uncharacterized membrane protein YdfJ with MMPL/SSD domain